MENGQLPAQHLGGQQTPRRRPHDLRTVLEDQIERLFAFSDDVEDEGVAVRAQTGCGQPEDVDAGGHVETQVDQARAGTRYPHDEELGRRFFVGEHLEMVKQPLPQLRGQPVEVVDGNRADMVLREPLDCRAVGLFAGAEHLDLSQ